MFELATVKLNRNIVEHGLVKLTWGNGSVFDRDNETVYIKPSGVDVFDMIVNDISNVNMDGVHLSGKKPSVDTDIHLELYKSVTFNSINSIVHTHSKYCTIFAQMQSDIPALGTTHADYFYGAIPVVDQLTPDEIENDYEKNTGRSVVNHFIKNKINPLSIPAALLPQHGLLTWGETADKALENAIVAELCAEMAYKQLQLCSKKHMNNHLLNKHFLRKHGTTKYYGQ